MSRAVELSKLHGQIVDDETLSELNTFDFTKHFYIRAEERHLRDRIGLSSYRKFIRELIKKPYIAFYCVDGSIVLGIDRVSYIAFAWSEKKKKWIALTYFDAHYSDHNFDINHYQVNCLCRKPTKRESR